MRQMADSTNPFDIPAGRFPIVAGYVDGLYAWPAAGWKYHDVSLHVTICAVTIDLDAMVADVESGALTTQDAVAFVRGKYARNQIPTLYFSISRRDEIYAALSAAGLNLDAGLQIWWADWDNRPVLDGDYGVAKQYANATLTGAHYDLSIVRDYWPGLDPLPPQPPAHGPGVGVEGWAGLQVKVDVDIPAFASELGVLASGLQGIG